MKKFYWLQLVLLLNCIWSCQDSATQNSKANKVSNVLEQSTSFRKLIREGDSLRTVNLDSAELKYQNAIKEAEAINNLEGKAFALKRIGDIGEKHSDFEKAEEYYKRALAIYEEISDTASVADIQASMGLVGWAQSDYNKAEGYFKKALKTYKVISDTIEVARMQNNLGGIYLTLGNEPKAIEYLTQTIRNAELLKDTFRLGSVYMNMGIIYAGNNTTKAEESYLRAIDFFKSLDEKEFPYKKYQALGLSNANLGSVYLGMKLPKKAITYFEQSLKDFKRIEGEAPEATAPLFFLGEAYRELDQYQLADQYYRQCLKEAKDRNFRLLESSAYIGLGKNYLAQKSYQMSLDQFNSGLKIAKDMGALKEQQMATLGLAQSYAGMNDFNSAYFYTEKYGIISDSLRLINVEEVRSKMQVQFDTERKENEISILNAENSLKEVQIEKEAKVRQFLIIGLFLFLVIIIGLIFLFFFIRQSNRKLDYEKKKSEKILLNILPKKTADELKLNGVVKAKKFKQITVLFTDFKEFSLITEGISPEKLVRSVDYYFRRFDSIVEKHGLEKIKTIGDAYMCAGGIPLPNDTHAEDAMKAAIDIIDVVKEIYQDTPPNIHPFEIRIGLNTGPVVAGVVGTKKFAYDIWGSTVNIAARMESKSEPGRINISESTYEILKDKYDFTYRGELEVKNGQMFKMYFADPREVATLNI